MYRIIGGDQQQYGPVSFEELCDWIQQGRAASHTLTQTDDSQNWVPLGELPEFADALARSWKQVVHFRPMGDDGTLAPARRTGEWSVTDYTSAASGGDGAVGDGAAFGDDVVIVRDERGVHIARESDD